MEGKISLFRNRKCLYFCLTANPSAKLFSDDSFESKKCFEYFDFLRNIHCKSCLVTDTFASCVSPRVQCCQALHNHVSQGVVTACKNPDPSHAIIWLSLAIDWRIRFCWSIADNTYFTKHIYSSWMVFTFTSLLSNIISLCIVILRFLKMF